MKTLQDIALSQYGVLEKPGTTHNPVILSYFKKIGHSWVQDDETAWCSAFMNWVALEAGYERSGELFARSWLKTGKETDDPKPNDVVVFSRGGKNSWKGHVGLFVNYDENRTHIYCLGGNQNNQVCIKLYPVRRLLGFRRLEKVIEIKST